MQINTFYVAIAALRGAQNPHVLTFQAYVHSGFCAPCALQSFT